MERIAYTRVYASVTGAVLILIGLFGFLTSSEFDSPELTSDLLGFFPVNGWANVFHLAAGLLALILARPASRLYALLAAIVFLGLGIWGIQAPDGEFLLDRLPAERSVNLFNLLLGATAVLALVAAYWDRLSVIGRSFEKRRQERRIRRKKRKRAKVQRARSRSAGKAGPSSKSGASSRAGADSSKPRS